MQHIGMKIKAIRKTSPAGFLPVELLLKAQEKAQATLLSESNLTGCNFSTLAFGEFHQLKICTIPASKISRDPEMEGTTYALSEAVSACLTLNSSYKYEHIQIINQFR